MISSFLSQVCCSTWCYSEYNTIIVYLISNYDVVDKLCTISPSQIDMEKVSVDTVKPWISQRINEILGFEDEVVIDFVFNMLETERVRLHRDL